MVEIRVKKEDLQETFLRAITKGSLSNREYSVLAACCKEKIITKHVRKNIQEKLGISQYNVNNIISKLKDRFFVQKEDNTIVVPEILRVTGKSVEIKIKVDD